MADYFRECKLRALKREEEQMLYKAVLHWKQHVLYTTFHMMVRYHDPHKVRKKQHSRPSGDHVCIDMRTRGHAPSERSRRAILTGTGRSIPVRHACRWQCPNGSEFEPRSGIRTHTRSASSPVGSCATGACLSTRSKCGSRRRSRRRRSWMDR